MSKRSRTCCRRAAVAVWGVAVALLGGWNWAAENAAVLLRVTGDVQHLADDAMQGRGPGTQGLEDAAAYISDQFRQLGLASGVPDGSYRQRFQVPISTEPVADETSLVLRGPEGQTIHLQLGRDFQSLVSGGSGSAAAPLVFAGYGITAPKLEYDDFAGLDVAGKVVLVIRREPQQDDANSVFDGQKTSAHAYIRTKLQQAKQRQAAAVLLVNDPFSTAADGRDELAAPSGFGTNPGGVPFAQLTQAIVDQMLAAAPLAASSGEELSSLEQVEDAIDKTRSPISQPIAGWSAELQCAFEKKTVEVSNIVGVLEGDGPRADETIVLGAHYDHIGFGEFGSRRPNSRAVHNGADDNASGTAAVIEMARRFAQRPQPPARRLVFIAFSAEEKGLLGSQHYLERPLYPLAATVAMFNYDMVGRLRNSELTIFGTHTAVEFAELVDRANSGEALKLKRADRMIRSGDHFGFYQQGIPAFHFFTGFTDEYHTPDDDFETLNMDGVVQTIDYTERLLDQVLTLPERPQYVPQGDGRNAQGGVPYLGIIPDYSADMKDLRISEIVADSPAAKADLKAGDVILKIGESSVSDVESLTNGLRRHRSGDMVDLVIRRGDQEVSCKVTLGRPPGR
jgi:hypothetical protein